MQYKLTEEQSTKFYNDLKESVDMVEKLQDKSIVILESWYDDYTNNHKSFFGFKPMSFEKFLKKICWGKGLVIKPEFTGRKISTIDGWTVTLRSGKISKLTNNEYIDLLSDINLVNAACISSYYYWSEYNTWIETIEKIDQYMTIPYTLDNDWMKILESIPRDTDLYRKVLERLEE